MQQLGMKPADLRKRAAKLGELRERIVAQPTASKARKTMRGPEPYVFEVGGVYCYPTRGGEMISPYIEPEILRPQHMVSRRFRTDARHRARPRPRLLSWYHAVTSIEVVPSIPHRTRLVGEICWS